MNDSLDQWLSWLENVWSDHPVTITIVVGLVVALLFASQLAALLKNLWVVVKALAVVAILGLVVSACQPRAALPPEKPRPYEPRDPPPPPPPGQEWVDS